MTHHLAIALLLVANTVTAAPRPTDFSGVWSNMTCDSNDSDRCGGFVLYLVQDGSRLCGTHFYATMGAGQLDEPDPPSITGSVNGTIASVQISSEDGSVFLANIQRTDNAVTWRRLKQTKEGQLNRWLIPEDSKLFLNHTAEHAKILVQVNQACQK